LTEDPDRESPSTTERSSTSKEEDDLRGKKGDKELLVEGYGLTKFMVRKVTSIPRSSKSRL